MMIDLERESETADSVLIEHIGHTQNANPEGEKKSTLGIQFRVKPC